MQLVEVLVPQQGLNLGPQQGGECRELTAGPPRIPKAHLQDEEIESERDIFRSDLPRPVSSTAFVPQIQNPSADGKAVSSWPPFGEMYKEDWTHSVIELPNWVRQGDAHAGGPCSGPLLLHLPSKFQWKNFKDLPAHSSCWLGTCWSPTGSRLVYQCHLE